VSPVTHVRRGDQEFTSRDREETIRRLWTFTDGLAARRIRLDSTVSFEGPILVVGPDGFIVGTATIDGAMFFTGTDFNVHTEDIVLDSEAGMTIDADDTIAITADYLTFLGGNVATDSNMLVSNEGDPMTHDGELLLHTERS
jgi:hypothetical protein